MRHLLAPSARGGIAVLGACLILATGAAGQTPEEPPAIDPGPPPGYTPPPLGDVVTPPFNAAAPASSTVRYGQRLELRVVSSFADGASFRWSKDGQPIAGATAPVLTIARVDAADAGRYRVDVLEDGEVVASVETVFSLVSGARLVNLSSRAEAWQGEQLLVSGFVISGSGSKTLLLRAVGPTIGAPPFGVSGTMAHPIMEVFQGENRLAQYLGWTSFDDQAALAEATAAAGAFELQPGSADSAAVRAFAPGAYTIHARGTGGETGVVLVELFDVTEGAPAAGLSNISSRAVVGAGDAVIIPGVVVSGAGPKPVLIRAVGPSLGPLGVMGFLPDPQFTVHRGDVAVGGNNNWGDFPAQDELEAATTAAGAFALGAGSRDAAGIFLLEPGAYTVVVSGVGGAGGIALVELYGLGD